MLVVHPPVQAQCTRTATVPSPGARAATAAILGHAEVLAPGRPTDPIQFIDVRDLGDLSVENEADGAARRRVGA